MNSEWIYDGHLAILRFHDETVSVELKCPGKEHGCEAHIQCSVCYGQGTLVQGPYPAGDYQDGEYRTERCERCGGSGRMSLDGTDCLLVHWTEHVGLELHHGEATFDGEGFPAPIRWRYGYADEEPEWRFAGAFYEDEKEPTTTEDA